MEGSTPYAGPPSDRGRTAREAVFGTAQTEPPRTRPVPRSDGPAKTVARLAAVGFVYLALCVATCLMLRMVLDYAAFRDDVDFLQFKRAYVGYGWWKSAFYVHVFCSVGALLAGFTQFSPSFLRNHRPLHRIIGRAYVYDILFINFPTGMVLAVCANGLLPGRIAFCLLDCLWFTFTLVAAVAASRGQIVRHRQYMIRSYALTLSAISLRSWKIILSNSFRIDPVHLYMIEAWVGFVPNLVLAEWLIRRRGTLTATVPSRA